MTIASALTAMNTDIVNARTAITTKGGTVTSDGGSSQLATDIATIPTGSSPVITSLNVTPTTSAQTITAPSGTDGYSPVNVAAVTAAIDSDIKASNIKSGISILGVTGNVVELNGETRTATLTSSAGNTFTPSSGKNAITSITVTPTNQARTVNPSTSSQSLTVNSGYSGNGTITVNPVTASIDANIQAGNIKKDVQILGVTGTYEGGSTPTGRYKLLDRVKTYGGNEIGTVAGFFTDANGVEYAIVCLDAAYRTVSAAYCSKVGLTTNMPIYNNMVTSNVYNAKETATQNCDLILAYCASKGYTSAAVNACRQWIFVMDGVAGTYEGQLPNLLEVVEILKQYNNIQAKDPTSSTNTSKNFATARGLSTSTQRNQDYYWRSESTGNISPISKTTTSFVCPILEIPNN